jgi:hypothetical protein
LLEPHIAPPKVVILCLFRTDLAQYADLPADLETVPEPPPREVLFRYRDDFVLPTPPGPVSGALGRFYYRSYVAARLASAMDRLAGFAGRAVAAGRRWLDRAGLALTRSDRSSAARAGSDGRSAAAEDLGLSNAVRLVTYIDQYFAARNAVLLVAFMPVGNENDVVRTSYARIAQALPARIPRCDLQAELGPTFRGEDYLGGLHYGRYASEEIGRRLAEEACAALRRRSPAPREVK